MKLVKLSETRHVMPDEISEVVADVGPGRASVRVIMRSGYVHDVTPPVLDEVMPTYRRLINNVNEALA